MLDQPSITPGQTLIAILIAAGVVCVVEAPKLLTQDRPITWTDIYQLPEAKPTPVIPPPVRLPQPQPTPGTRVTLYRAVDLIELSVVRLTGTYGYAPSGNGKYFAYTYDGVVKFAKSNFNSGRQMTITSIDVPSDFLTQGYPFNDIGGAGLSIHFSNPVLPELYSVMSPIRILGSP